MTLRDIRRSTGLSIRKLHHADIAPLYKMYKSLTARSKYFFHPGFLELAFVNVLGLLKLSALILSTSKFLRRVLLRVFPFSVFLSLVATDKQDKLVGFCYVKVDKRLSKGGFLGNLGIVVGDEYQGKGVGSELMKNMLSLAREEDVRKIHLTVLPENVEAIRLYEKFGFKRVGIIESSDVWDGETLDYVQMSLSLSSFQGTPRKNESEKSHQDHRPHTLTVHHSPNSFTFSITLL